MKTFLSCLKLIMATNGECRITGRYRHNGEWKLRAVGQGYAGGLHAMAISHGVNVQ